MIRTLTAAFAAITLAGAASAGGKGPHADDIYLKVLNGRIATGTFDEGVFRRSRVFGAAMGVDFPNFADEPGFESAKGTFTPDTSIGFDLLGPLMVWTGASFAADPDLAMEVAKGPESRFTGGVGSVVTGFALPVDEDGDFHEHYDYSLHDLSRGDAIEGIFLLSMRLWSTDDGVGRSTPYWIVFNQGIDDTIHDEAIDWVRDNIVPAPGAGIAALMIGAGAFARRRR